MTSKNINKKFFENSMSLTNGQRAKFDLLKEKNTENQELTA